MKLYSAYSIFVTIFSILFLASCIKKDPEFGNALKALENPDLWTMNYTMKTGSVNSTTPGGNQSVIIKKQNGF